MKRQRSLQEKPVLELVEEAFHLVRRGPVVALMAYGLGTLPFILALLFFWSDMAHSAFAEERLARGSLGLTLLFVWMKAWQSVCARHWLAWLSGEPPPRWRVRWLARIGAWQAALQPFGLFILPLCLVAVAPLAWAYPFFTNLTVFAGGESPTLRTLARRSWRQAALWPAQNLYLMFIMKLFGLFVLLNLLSAVLITPFLLKMLLGIETVFSRNPWAAFNSTLVMALIGLTYLCLDPILKAIYTLRCFYGEALQTGADLRADLKRFQHAPKLAAAALVLLTTLRAAPAALAQEAGAAESSERRTQPSAPEIREPVSPPALDRKIGEVIQQREYSWRLPREAAPLKATKTKLNWLDRFLSSIGEAMKAVGRWIVDAFEWLFKQFRPAAGPAMGPLDLASALRSLLIVLMGVLAGLLLWLLIRIWRRRRLTPEAVLETITATPNLEDENIGADELPEDGWMKLARELLERGELRLALRALYLATLAHLAERNLITLAKFKSNRDYERELARRGHGVAELPDLFERQVSVFERAWYGLHEVTQEAVSDFAHSVERIKAGA
jgi:hypothetical protein